MSIRTPHVFSLLFISTNRFIFLWSFPFPLFGNWYIYILKHKKKNLLSNFVNVSILKSISSSAGSLFTCAVLIEMYSPYWHVWFLLTCVVLIDMCGPYWHVWSLLTCVVLDDRRVNDLWCFLRERVNYLFNELICLSYIEILI